jgi:hypothetical protein
MVFGEAGGLARTTADTKNGRTEEIDLRATRNQGRVRYAGRLGRRLYWQDKSKGQRGYAKWY